MSEKNVDYSEYTVLTPELGERLGQLLSSTGHGETAEAIGTVIMEQNWDAGADDTPEGAAAIKGLALTFADEAARAVRSGLIEPKASGATGRKDQYGDDDYDEVFGIVAVEETEAEAEAEEPASA